MRKDEMFVRFVILLFVHCTLLGFGKACGLSEYKSAAGECCPMCSIGSVVHKDCTGDLSTSCQPCAPGTFISEPNGLHSCFPCKNCDESQGLYIQSKCTTVRDTICDVLDGYYCSDYSNSQCSRAVKHSVCKPGQETKTPGTKTSDAVCVDCISGYFSPSGLNCTKWTDCTARNGIKTENGSFVKDVTCTPKRQRYGLICAVVLTVFFIILLLIRAQYPPEETFSANTMIAQPTGELEEP
ncbi:si:ch211-261n11.8 isoform X2 [Chanodichthys erythropterus]|uniref:si:ch211-261n11.8 isoform X2 n=1 Tax=Chanodichthys erythropterus TaxID=933992 RepID=UPI00351E2E11